MHEQNNTQLIQSLYDAFGRGDIAFILSNVTPQTTWTMEGPSTIPFAGKRTGASEIVGFFEGLDRSCTDMKLIPQHFVAQGDMVATFGRFSGAGKATGRRFDIAYAHYFQIRDGKVAAFEDFND